MPEQLLDHPQLRPPATELEEQAAAEPALQKIEIDGQTFETDLPNGVQPFEATGYYVKDLRIRPAELDSLPVGISHVQQTREIWTDDGKEIKTDTRELTVTMTELGKVVSVDSFSEHWPAVQNDTEKLLAVLGFVVDTKSAQVQAVPTPQTLKAAAGRIGIEIAYFNGSENSGRNNFYIKGEDYVGAFSEGKYPVSLGVEAAYRHDIEDDHLTTMVLGGEPLKEALKEVGSNTLASQDEDTIKLVAVGIDRFTATLRAVITSHSEMSGEAYGSECGRKTYLDTAAEIDISIEVATEILETAQDNARLLGITPTQLA